MTAAPLSLRKIGHVYLGRTVIDGIDLSVAHGEVVALVGPSGCGKSTLVHIAAAVIDPVRGQVVRRYARQGMVFQEPRLLPWATARDNIAYPLRLAGRPRKECVKRAEETALSVTLLRDDLDKYPVELSGGMRQRVSIARALVVEPDFVYFDEPFTALDVAIKRRLQDLVIAAAAASRFAAIFVTHDLFEAARVAHRIVVLDSHGRGIMGERHVPGEPGSRDDASLFSLVQRFLGEDPLFRHIHDIDERRIA